MAIFHGTNADETITPTFVSPTVTRNPAGSFPGDTDDHLDGGGGNDTLDGGAGNDWVDGGYGDDTLYGGAGNDHLWGNAVGAADNDTLYGGDGNDTLNAGLGTDIMEGGAGDDLYQYIGNGGDIVIENPDAGHDHVYALIAYTLPANVEDLSIFGNAHEGTGNDLDNFIEAAGGTNVLSGLAGNDTLKGGDGHDTLLGGDGDDTLDGRAGSDTLDGGAGDDLLVDTALVDKGAASMDTLLGGDGNDTLDGGLGADTMDGGNGDDLYFVDNVGDVVQDTGDGIDSVRSSVSFTLSANIENLTLATGRRDATGTGNGRNNVITSAQGNDVLYGLGGNDTLDGGAGADTMDGGLGDDLYVVNAAGDIVVEAAGGGVDTVQSSVSYTLSANVEKLTLTGHGAINGTGNDGANTIRGNSGNNVLSGGLARDTLAGGGGSDTLTGGDGNDTFQFDVPLVAGSVTTITDFDHGGDKIALSASVFTQAGPLGALAAAAFYVGTAAHDGDDRIIYNNANGNVMYDPDGMGGQAATVFAKLAPGLAVSAGDFKIT